MGKRKKPSLGSAFLNQHAGSRFADTKQTGLKPFGKFDAYSLAPQTTAKNQQYNRAMAQGKLSKMGRGLQKFGIKTATRTIGGIGYAAGAVDGLVSELFNPAEDNFQKVYNNGLAKAMEHLEEEYAGAPELEIFRSRAGEGNILDQMFTTEFWADDVGDGLAFMASAMLGAKGAGVVTKGASMAAKGTKAASLAQKAGNLTGVRADTAIATVFNTINEAGVEANETNKAVYEKLIADGMSKQEAKWKAAKAAQQVFTANAMILLLPNAIQSSMFTNAFNETSDVVNRALRRGKLDLEDVSTVGIMGKNIATSIVSEGLWEENVQLASSNYFQRMAEFDKSPNFGEAIAGIAGEMVNNFHTDEGQKSMVLGAIIGTIGAGASSFGEAKGIREENAKLLEAVEGIDYAAYGQEVGAGFKKDSNGEYVLDENGEPIIDPNTLGAIAFQGAFDKKLHDEYTQAQLNNDKYHGKLVKDQALSRHAYRIMNNEAFGTAEQAAGMLDLIIADQAAQVQEDNPGMYQGSSELATSKAQVAAYKELYKRVNSDIRPPLGGLNGAELEFHNRVKAAAFGAGVRAQSYRDMEAMALADNNEELAGKLGGLAEDAEQLYTGLRDKKARKSMYQGWLEASNSREAILTRLEQANRQQDSELIYREKKELALHDHYAGTTEVNGRPTANDFTILAESPEDQAKHRTRAEDSVTYKVGNSYLNKTKLDEEVLENGVSPSDAVGKILDETDAVGPEFTKVANRYLAQETDHLGSEWNNIENAKDQVMGQLSPAAVTEDGRPNIDSLQLPAEFSGLTETDEAKLKEYQELESQQKEIEAQADKVEEVNNRLFRQKDYTQYEQDASRYGDGVLALRAKEDLQVPEYMVTKANTPGFVDSLSIESTLINTYRDRAFYIGKLRGSVYSDRVQGMFDKAITDLENALELVETRKKNVFAAQAQLKQTQLELIQHVTGVPYGNYEEARHALETADPTTKQAYVDEFNAFQSEIKDTAVKTAGKAVGGKMYNGFPETSISNVLNAITLLAVRPSVYQHYIEFQNFLDITKLQNKLLGKLDETTYNAVMQLANNHLYYTTAEKLKMELTSKITYPTVLKSMKIAADSLEIYPTLEQTIAVRNLIFKLFSPNNPTNLGNASFMMGVAGTGKTTIVKLAIEAAKQITSLGLSSNDIISAAHTPEASKTIADSIGTPVNTFDQLLNTDLSKKKLVVVDEAGGLNNKQLKALQQKLEGLNTKVIFLGDPTQISAKLDIGNDLSVSNYLTRPVKGVKNLFFSQPLSLVMRTSVSDIATVSELFRSNSQPVDSITASASHPFQDSYNKPIGVHVASNPASVQGRLKANLGNGRTKMIILGNEAQRAEYAAFADKDPQLQILTAFEAQGATVQEAYVDIRPNQFNSVQDYNRVMYTATSRPSDYLVVGNIPNYNQVVSSNVRNNDSNRLEMLDKLKTDFNNNIESELALYEEEEIKPIPKKRGAFGEEQQPDPVQAVEEEQPLTNDDIVEAIEEGFNDIETTEFVESEETTEVVEEGDAIVEEVTYPEEEVNDEVEDAEETVPVDPDTPVIEGEEVNIFSDNVGRIVYPTINAVEAGETLDVVYYDLNGATGLGFFNENNELVGIDAFSEPLFSGLPKSIRDKVFKAMENGTPVKATKKGSDRVTIKDRNAKLATVTVANKEKAHVKYKPTRPMEQGESAVENVIDLVWVSNYFGDALKEDIRNNSQLFTATSENTPTPSNFKLTPGVLYMEAKASPKSNPLYIRMGVAPIKPTHVHHLKKFTELTEKIVSSTGLAYPSTELNETVKAFSKYWKTEAGEVVPDPNFNVDVFAAAWKRNTKEDVPSEILKEFDTMKTMLPEYSRMIYGTRRVVQKFNTKEAALEEARKLGITNPEVSKVGNKFTLKPKGGSLQKIDKFKYGEGSASKEMRELALANASLKIGRPLRKHYIDDAGNRKVSSVPLLGSSDSYSKELVAKFLNFVNSSSDSRVRELGSANNLSDLINGLNQLNYEQDVLRIINSTDQAPPFSLQDLKDITESFDQNNNHSLQADYIRKRDGQLAITSGNTYLRPNLPKVPYGKGKTAEERLNPQGISSMLGNNLRTISNSRVAITSESEVVATPTSEPTPTPPTRKGRTRRKSKGVRSEVTEGSVDFNINDGCK